MGRINTIVLTVVFTEPAYDSMGVVLGLIFLKFASDKFEYRKQELVEEGKEKFVDMTDFYTMKNVFYLPAVARWNYIKDNSKQDDIAIKIDTALFTDSRPIKHCF